MAKHWGKYQPDNPQPYLLGRGKMEDFIRCEACFWMNRVKGIKFKGMPGFTLNARTDELLKIDFDKHRELQTPHPFMVESDLEDLVPFQHEDFQLWTNALQFGLQTHHKETNLIFGGGLDDIWQDTKTKQLHVVEYKSTATKKTPITLDGVYKVGYKRQVAMYQWILRQKGFDVSDMTYFVYVNGYTKAQEGFLEGMDWFDYFYSKGNMEFEITLIEHIGDDSWVEDTLYRIKECLHSEVCPEHAKTGFGYKGDKQCENAETFEGMKANNISL